MIFFNDKVTDRIFLYLFLYVSLWSNKAAYYLSYNISVYLCFLDLSLYIAVRYKVIVLCYVVLYLVISTKKIPYKLAHSDQPFLSCRASSLSSVTSFLSYTHWSALYCADWVYQRGSYCFSASKSIDGERVMRRVSWRSKFFFNIISEFACVLVCLCFSCRQ